MEEAADAVGVTEQTIRIWVGKGLPAMTATRPSLILGCALKAFLARKEAGRRKPLGPGEFYCFRCKAGRRAALGLVDYHPISESHGRLQAFCETCEGPMCLNVSARDLPSWRAFYDIANNAKDAA